MKRRFKWRSLRARISVLFTAALVFLVLTAGIVLFLNYRQVLLELHRAHLDMNMTQNKQSLETLFDRIDQATQALFIDQPLTQGLKNTPYSSADILSSLSIINDRLVNNVYVPLGSAISAYNIMLLVDENMPLASSLPIADKIYYGVFNNGQMREKAFYREALEANGAMTVFMDPEENRLVFARVIKGIDTEASIGELTVWQRLGVALISIDTRQIDDKLQSKLTPNTLIFMALEDGGAVYGPWDAETELFIKSQLSGRTRRDQYNPVTKTVTYNNENYILNLQTFRLGLHLIAMTPVWEIYAMQSPINQYVVIVLVLAVGAGGVLSFGVSHRIAKPIHALSSAMQNTRAKEDLSVSLDYSGEDEIGILYKSYNDMLIQISRLMNETCQSASRAQLAQAQALQAQINPHFLYNTLDTISWMAMTNTPDDIVPMVSCLSSIFRYSIGGANNDAKVVDEIKCIKNYADIQRRRFGEAFDISYELSGDVMDCKVPRLILQPLVENCILHGFSGLTRTGKIVISGEISGDNLIITVSDNGIGADTEMLNRYITTGAAWPGASDRHGIKNVNNRIQLIYGESYGLYFRENAPQGLAAVLVLPWKDSARSAAFS